MNELFSGAAEVSIQGARVLRLIDFTGNQAKYEVIGFENIPMVIIDSRVRGLRAIQGLLETGDLHAFAPEFNHPAEVRIASDENEQIVIELKDTNDTPAFVLWIAIGLGNSMPVYCYHFENIIPLSEEGKYAMAAVYQISSAYPRISRSDLALAVSSPSSVT